MPFAGGRSAGCVSGEAPLAGLHELLRPGVIQALGDPFLAAQLGNAVLAAQAFQHDPDLVFGREVPTRRTPDVLPHRSEEHTSELQSLMRISYAVFCLKKTNYDLVLRNTCPHCHYKYERQ